MWFFHTPLDHITAKNKAKQIEDHKSFLTFSSMSSISAPSVVWITICPLQQAKNNAIFDKYLVNQFPTVLIRTRPWLERNYEHEDWDLVFIEKLNGCL